jgi:hypothetical protein
MTNIVETSNFKRYRLWALPGLIAGFYFLAKAWSGSSLQLGLLGAGLALSGIFALRHDLRDISPSGLDPKQLGVVWIAILCASVLLILAAAAVALSA